MVEFEVIELGKPVKYSDMLNIQWEKWKDVKAGASPHTLYLLEHTPVVTLGRRTNMDHLLLTESEFKDRKIDLVEVKRGGSATFHGPGQVVGYIICKVSLLGGTYNLVKQVLQLVVGALKHFGISSNVEEENPGVWTDDKNPRKLAAVGMQVKEGYSLHGFAINVNLSLLPFTYIVPCGLQRPVSSISIETGKTVSVKEVKRWINKNLKNFLGNKNFNNQHLEY